MHNKSLILASASPRRRALLEQIGIPHEVLPTDIPEVPGRLELAEDYVARIALEKARAAAQIPLARGRPVLAADTEVVLDGAIFGKPRDLDEAGVMLERLSGREHFVLSQVTLLDESGCHCALSVSQVRFRPLEPREIKAYLKTGEPLGKAGGYAIQGLGAILIERLSGSYSGVMGLPLEETGRLLRRIGLDPLDRALSP